MASLKIELNSAGIQELLKSAEVQNMLESEAEKISGRCGNGYKTDRKVLSTKAVASVYTATKAAKQDNLKNETLLRAMR